MHRQKPPPKTPPKSTPRQINRGIRGYVDGLGNPIFCAPPPAPNLDRTLDRLETKTRATHWLALGFFCFVFVCFLFYL